MPPQLTFRQRLRHSMWTQYAWTKPPSPQVSMLDFWLPASWLRGTPKSKHIFFHPFEWMHQPTPSSRLRRPWRVWACNSRLAPPSIWSSCKMARDTPSVPEVSRMKLSNFWMWFLKAMPLLRISGYTGKLWWVDTNSVADDQATQSPPSLPSFLRRVLFFWLLKFF